MEYFNSFFNYSIYFCVALGMAAAVAGFLQALTASPGLVHARAVLGGSLLLGLGVAAIGGVPRYRDFHFGDAAGVDAARAVSRAAEATLPPGSVCFLDCDDWSVWPAAISVALQLDRMGHKVRVNDYWVTLFGRNRTITNDPADLAKPVVCWKILPAARDPAQLSRYPVIMNAGILVKRLAEMDPAHGSIQFTAAGNFNDYASFGWEPTKSDFTVNNQRAALVQFRPLPVPGDVVKGVDVFIKAWSPPNPKTSKPQRVEVVFNNVTLATVPLAVGRGTGDEMKIHLDAALWREAAARENAKLLFRFPDAVSSPATGVVEERAFFTSVDFRLDP